MIDTFQLKQLELSLLKQSPMSAQQREREREREELDRILMKTGVWTRPVNQSIVLWITHSHPTDHTD